MQAEMLDSTISNSLQLFADKGFKIRVIMRCSDPWFVAKDVATCIEHSNVSKMCELCRDKDKIVIGMDEIATNDLLVTNMTRELLCISESGLYRILAKCNLPKCEPFESWVFDEVLPSIRKTGSYSVAQPQAQPTIYDYARALIAEKERSDALINRGVVNDVKNLTSLNIKNEKARRISRVSDMKHVDVSTSSIPSFQMRVSSVQ